MLQVDVNMMKVTRHTETDQSHASGMMRIDHLSLGLGAGKLKKTIRMGTSHHISGLQF